MTFLKKFTKRIPNKEKGFLTFVVSVFIFMALARSMKDKNFFNTFLIMLCDYWLSPKQNFAVVIKASAIRFDLTFPGHGKSHDHCNISFCIAKQPYEKGESLCTKSA